MLYILFALLMFASFLCGMDDKGSMEDPKKKADLKEQLSDAISREDIEKVGEYLSKGADPFAGIELLLAHPKAKGAKDMLQFLLERGANPDGVIEIEGSDLWFSYLHYASNKGLLDCVLCLLAYGANVDNNVEKCKRTPLMYVASWYPHINVEVMKALLVGGARVDIKDDKKKRVVDYLHSKECKGMLYDFEWYKAENPREFYDVEDRLNTFIEKKQYARFLREVERRGRFNVLHGY